MARTKAATANATQQNKLVIDRRIGTLFLENKVVRTNKGKNKSQYVPVDARELGHDQPVAIYANIDEIESGTLYTLVQFKPSEEGETGMYALNKPTLIERMKYLGNMAEESGMTVAEVKAELGIQ